MLVDGKWTAEWHPVQAPDKKGGFVRQTSGFRNWVTPDGSAGPTGEGGFAAESGRYHLYVALICPWASRTLIGRKLKKLEEVISVSVVEPALSDEGWKFGDYPGSDRDTLNGFTYMHEVYTSADPHYTGRATVPVLWDKKTKTIVNNESADILRMMLSMTTSIRASTTAFTEPVSPPRRSPMKRRLPMCSRRFRSSKTASYQADLSCSAIC